MTATAGTNVDPSPPRPVPLDVADVPAVVDLHLKTLPPSFFGALGKRFLRTYYRGFVESPYSVALTVHEGGVPVGFVVGAASPAAHARWVMRNHGTRLALGGTAGLLRRPTLLVRFLRTRLGRYARGVLRRLRRQAGPVAGAAERRAVLAHLAVAPQCRRHGFGAVLVRALIEETRRRGCSAVELVTRADGTAGAFYERLDFVSASRYENADGVEWIRYVHHID